MPIKLDLTEINADISVNEAHAKKAYEALLKGDCLGAQMRGWLNAPDMPESEIKRLESAARRINEKDALVVVGVGGSYLGARAAIDFVISPEYNALPKKTPDIYFAGTSFSGDALSDLLKILDGRDFMINVVSKSGTTLEPAAAFCVLRGELEKRFGADGADRRIIATTDAESGFLRKEAEKRGWETFTVPDNVGGRYSVLTPVGLLPMAAAGIDIRAALKGARRAFSEYANYAVCYAAARSALFERGKSVELFALTEPALRAFGEWLKQLFGESGGKNGGGLFPASVIYTTDLHSVGQYVQEGARLFAETFVRTEGDKSGLLLPEDDSLGFASGRSFEELNSAAFDAAKKAHLDGGVPAVSITADSRSAESFGELAAFFELSCAIACVMRGINAFDQPGVEAYKRNMRELFTK